MDAPFGDHGTSLRSHQGGHRDEDDEELTQPGPRPVTPSLAKDTVVVFDWDDTILPTSWLQRIHALTVGAQLQPEVQRQMNALAQLAGQTLALASTMATVMFITNSAPGWVDQSCQLFLPGLLNQVRTYPIFAKPMHAPVTFKIGAFRRECYRFRNLVSIGDGDAERAATLRLNAPQERRSPDEQHCLKSVKLIELPTCQQLLSQHEMLQVRMADVVAFQGNLDLKARFPPMSIGSPSKQKGGGCTLVHFNGRPQQSHSASAPVRRYDDGGGSATMPGALPSGTPKYSGSTPFGRAGLASTGPRQDGGNSGGQLPPLGTQYGGPGASSAAGVMGGTAAGFKFGSALRGTDCAAGGAGAASGIEGPDHDIGGPDAPVPGRGSNSLWKVQERRASGRSTPGVGTSKRRPMLVPGIGQRVASASWREHSAPAGARGLGNRD
eukprot:gnl/TRDRNA2_/TRDRNA2_188887_c0_seq1.p1 gnl/TRDRNA2_/TRDRNA2_188887_c0~~gnl/TRDRNA2_/TRDRNA2_188887_c0_seq1.p1  ORF type:complete len:438 (+),score=53.23 gnl/TRDRNA2_/TRDRNA2_188887_c0_seq1:58-1371(+)